MGFTDHAVTGGTGHPFARKDCLLSAGGHLLLLILGLITFSGSTVVMPMGDGSVAVSMISLDSGAQSSLSPDVRPPEELPAEVPLEQPEDHPPEDVVEQPEEMPEEAVEQPLEVVETPDEIPAEIQETPEEHPAENPPRDEQPSTSTYASLTGSGTAGAGMPGPGTYESRVFNAVRRGFRTSVEPEESYRIILTVHPDGTRSVEIVRTSGILAFDRAVENALSLAQIPPMPPGRDNPVVLNIEFLGPE
jgi:outer membrane biosynthesis protein TonB